jgi:hypothetical protein
MRWWISSLIATITYVVLTLVSFDALAGRADAAPGRNPPNFRPSMPPRPPPPAPIPPRPFDFDNGLKNAGSRFFGLAGATAGQTSGTSGVSGQSGQGGLGGNAGGGGFAGNGQLGGGFFGGGFFGGGFGGKQFGMDGGNVYREPAFRHGVGIYGGSASADGQDARPLSSVEPTSARQFYRPVTWVRRERPAPSPGK